MEIIKLYRLEIWDGGDRHNPNGFYLTTKADADKWKEENEYETYSEVSLKVCDSLEDLKNSSRVKLKEQALAKLSQAERDALGF